jgi:hypothetical protein
MGLEIKTIESEDQELTYKAYAESLRELIRMNKNASDFIKIIDNINTELYIWGNK